MVLDKHEKIAELDNYINAYYKDKLMEYSKLEFEISKSRQLLEIINNVSFKNIMYRNNEIYLEVVLTNRGNIYINKQFQLFNELELEIDSLNTTPSLFTKLLSKGISIQELLAKVGIEDTFCEFDQWIDEIKLHYVIMTYLLSES